MIALNQNLSVLYRSDHLSIEGSFEKKMSKIRKDFESIFYKKGQVLFNEGNIPRGLFYVESGKVKIAKYGSDGKEQIISIAKPGDFIGYKSLLTNTHYNVSASILEDATLTFIPKDDFSKLFRVDTDVADKFTKMLCDDLIALEEKMVSMAYTPVRGRLAETLLALDEVYKEEKRNISFINLSRMDLANIVGTAKETVIRLLTEFKTEKLISTEGKLITILDPQGLLRINQLYR